MGKHFSVDELVASEAAKRAKIANIPDDEDRDRMNYLLIPALDSIREGWGSPIIVTSGYRSPFLNLYVGGSPTSAHLMGYAADLVPKNGKLEEFKAYMREWAKENIFDQIITERSGKSEWVHFGLSNQKGEQRRQVFNMVVK